MTYSRHSAYRQASATAWTRIDMLLALYDAALLAVEQGHHAIQAGQTEPLIQQRFRAQRLIAELMDGVDAEHGDLPRNVQRLLGFCLSRVAASGEADWSAAKSILSQLRDSFRSIRDQAAQLEQSGEIPPIDLGTPDMLLAVG